MARNRVIYQSEALYVSKDASVTGSGDHKQLERIQSANYNFNISRQDVNQFGQLGKVGSMVLEAPTVSFDTSYLLTDGFNERALGFYVQTGAAGEGSFVSGHLADGSGKNLYITTVAEGLDATGVDANKSGDDVIGIGNCYLTDYTLDLSVGSLPTVSVSFEAANIQSTAGNAKKNPAVKQSDGTQFTDSGIALPNASTGSSSQVALRPGDITINLNSVSGSNLADIGGPNDADSAHIQSASLSIPLSRSPLQRLGTKYAYARAVDFPVQATLSVNAIVNEVEARNLTDVINNETGYDITLRLKDESSTDAMIFKMKGAQIQSESFSSSIGSNKSVDLTFVTSIGGPNDLRNGVFVSGANHVTAF